MIIEIRKFTKSKTAKSLVILIVAALGGAFSIPMLFKRSSGAPWAAQVNGQEISYRYFVRKRAEQDNRIRQLRAQYGDLADMLMQSMGMMLDPGVMALRQSVREELVNQFADKLNLHLDDTFVDQMLGDRNFLYRELSGLIPPQFIDPRGGIQAAQLKEYLRRLGMSMADFEQEVEQLLRRSLALNLAIGAVYLPKSQLRSRYIQQFSPRSFSLLTFDFSHYLEQTKKDAVTDEQLRQHYNMHNSMSKKYWIPEKRVGQVWEFDRNSYGVTVTKEEIQTYYDDQKQRRFIEVPVKMEVRHILFDVPSIEKKAGIHKQAQALQAELKANPSLFAQKAKELSADKESASKGGLLPAFTRGTHEREFDMAAFLLQNDGEISEVVETSKGLHIIQRVKRIPAQFKSLNKVRSEIEPILANRKFKNHFYKDIKLFMDDNATQAERDVLLNRARTSFVTEPLEKSKEKLNISLFKSKEGSFDFYSQEDKMFIVKTTGITKRYLPELEAIKDTVKGDFQEAQAAKALTKALELAYAQAKNKDFEALASEFSAKLSKTGTIKLDDAEKMKELRQKGLPIEAMISLEKKGSVGMYRGSVDGYLFALDTITPFDEQAFEEKLPEMRQALYNETVSIAVEALVAFLRRQATIEINEQIVGSER